MAGERRGRSGCDAFGAQRPGPPRPTCPRRQAPILGRSAAHRRPGHCDIAQGFGRAVPAPTLAKYDPDQQRVPSGSGLTSGQWTDEATSPSNPTIEAPNVRPSLHAEEVSTSDSPQAAGQQALPRPFSNPRTSSRPLETVADQATPGHATPQFNVRLPVTIAGPQANLFDVSWFTDAVKAAGDGTEVFDSIAKWRELGPRGELALMEAASTCPNRGWRNGRQRHRVRRLYRSEG
jgi:hypothetical protein